MSPGPVARLLDRLSQSQAESEAEELTRVCSRAGCTRIERLTAREVAQVTGCVHSLTAEPRQAHPQLAVELYDGTEMLQLIWLGRRQIEGIRPGAFLTVEGRVTELDGRLTIFNPGYHLLPGDE